MFVDRFIAPEAGHALSPTALIDTGTVLPGEGVRLMMELIGKELQTIQPEYRRMTLARLRGKADMLRSLEAPDPLVDLIDVLCDSCEAGSPVA